MWHQNRELAELTSESAVRFTVPGGSPTRRVSAFQKGFRPASDPVQDEGLALDTEQTRARDTGLPRCFYSGDLAIAYSAPMELYRSLLPSHLGRYEAMFRRAGLSEAWAGNPLPSSQASTRRRGAPEKASARETPLQHIPRCQARGRESRRFFRFGALCGSARRCFRRWLRK